MHMIQSRTHFLVHHEEKLKINVCLSLQRHIQNCLLLSLFSLTLALIRLAFQRKIRPQRLAWICPVNLKRGIFVLRIVSVCITKPTDIDNKDFWSKLINPILYIIYSSKTRSSKLCLFWYFRSALYSVVLCSTRIDIPEQMLQSQTVAQALCRTKAAVLQQTKIV